MKIRWMVVSSLLFLLAFMACVSAADNLTDANATKTEPLLESEDISSDINVTFDEQVWEKDLGNISVELPESASGDFCIKINDEAIYNETITEHSFEVPIKLPKP